MPKISVIIPFYPLNKDKYPILQTCLKSLPEHYETIVIWHNEGGMAWAINRGVECATGTHFLIMNDDVEFVGGNLNDLCSEETCTSPSFMGRTYDYLWGSCFCIPRKVWEVIGNVDEQYDGGYYVDDDIIATILKNDYKCAAVPSVVFNHKHPGTTLAKDPKRDESSNKNRIRFEQKWTKK